MRKGETFEEEAARKKAERELPDRIHKCTGRVDTLIAVVKGMITTLQRNHTPNKGGEKSGQL